MVRGRDDLVWVESTNQDCYCGSCRKIIQKGSSAYMGEGKMLDGRNKPVTVQVFYCPKSDCLPSLKPRVRKIEVPRKLRGRKPGKGKQGR